MRKHNIIRGGELLDALCQALGMEADAPVRRVIVDADCEGVVKVYVEMLGDERLLSVDWAAGLAGAEIHGMDR